MVVPSTCFFIDDNADNLSVFTKALHYVAPETVCFVATNTTDALDLMRTERLVPSCLFIKGDFNLAGTRDFLRALKFDLLFRYIPVVVHGTELNVDDIKELKSLGVLAFYTKSLSFLGVSNMLSLYFRPKLLGIGQN